MARIFADSDGPCKGDSCLLEEDLQRSPTPGVMRHVPMGTKTSSVRPLQLPGACCVPRCAAQHASAPLRQHAYMLQLLSILRCCGCCSACTSHYLAAWLHYRPLEPF